jgi:hypothetical protein
MLLHYKSAYSLCLFKTRIHRKMCVRADCSTPRETTVNLGDKLFAIMPPARAARQRPPSSRDVAYLVAAIASAVSDRHFGASGSEPKRLKTLAPPKVLQLLVLLMLTRGPISCLNHNQFNDRA